MKKYLRRILPEREDITVHSIRDSCCDELLRARVPIYTVQRWLRHADFKTIQRYAELLNMDISEMIGRCLASFGQFGSGSGFEVRKS
jgi:integrase